MGKTVFASLAAALFVAAVLAGCSGDSTDTGTDDGDGPGLVSATDTKGGIRGVVVDPAIRPIKGVTIQVTDAGKETTTDELGFFIVNDLEPGEHLVRATHPFFETQQKAVAVQAGIRDPDAVRFQLVAKTSDRPYFNTVHFQGFITCSMGTYAFASEECGEGVGVPCDVPAVGCQRIGGNADNHVQFDFYVDGPAIQTIVVEQVWTPNSEQTGRFYTVTATNWTCDPVCGGNELNVTRGESPLYARVDADVLSKMEIDDATRFSTFTWPNWNDSETEANAAVNQDFDLYVTFFYVLPAPDGWSLVQGSPDPY